MNSYQLARITQDPIDPDHRVLVHRLFTKKLRKHVIPNHYRTKEKLNDFYSFYTINNSNMQDIVGTDSQIKHTKRRITRDGGSTHPSFTSQSIETRISSKKVTQNKNESSIVQSDNKQYVMSTKPEPPRRGKKIFIETRRNTDIIQQSFPSLKSKSEKKIDPSQRSNNVAALLIDYNDKPHSPRPKSASMVIMRSQNSKDIRPRSESGPIILNTKEACTSYNIGKQRIDFPISRLGKRGGFKHNEFRGCNIFGNDAKPPKKPARTSFMNTMGIN